MKNSKIALLVPGLLCFIFIFDMVVFPRGIPRDLPFLGWYATGDKYIYNLVTQEEKQEDEYRISLIGSSMVQKGLQTEAIEKVLSEKNSQPIRVFNFAIGGAYVCDYLLSFQRAQLATPDLIVIGISWRDFLNDDEVDPKNTGVYKLLYDGNENVPEFMKTDSFEENTELKLKQVWSLYKYRQWIRMNSGSLIRAIIEPSREKNIRYFVESPDTDWNRIEFLVRASYEKSDRVYPNKQSVCMEEMLSLKQQTKILVVNLPIHSLWFKEDRYGMQVAYKEMVENVLGLNAIQYVDASSVCRDGYFIDSKHLGVVGSLFFSEWLAENIHQIM